MARFNQQVKGLFDKWGLPFINFNESQNLVLFHTTFLKDFR